MLHFEVEVEVDDLEAAIAIALEAGAEEAPWPPPDRNPARLRVVLDPAVTRSASSYTASKRQDASAQ